MAVVDLAQGGVIAFSHALERFTVGRRVVRRGEDGAKQHISSTDEALNRMSKCNNKPVRMPDEAGLEEG